MLLERVQLSPALVAEARDRDEFEVVSEPEPVAFDADGQYERDVINR